MERAQPYFVYINRFILFVLLIYLIWGLFKHFQFNFDIYITNEHNRRNQNQKKSNNMIY